MSLKEGLFGFIDNVSLPAIFSRKAENLKELRQPLLKGIANARRQFDSGQTRAPHRWWKLSNDVVALTVKVSGNVLTINGTDINHIPADRFIDFLDKFAAAVDAGEFDDELRHKGEGDATVKIPGAKRTSAKTTKPLKATDPADMAAPATGEEQVVEKATETTPPPKQAPRAGKPAKSAAPKAKRKPIDAKTAHARATKAAVTRAANKAKTASPTLGDAS